MAPVNPELKLISESYIDRSRGVSVPDNIKPTGQDFNNIQPRGIAEGNRAAEYAGKAEATKYQLEANTFDKRAAVVNAADNAYKYGVTITDKLIKDRIERDVYDQVNQEREGYIAELQGIKSRLDSSGKPVNNLLDANAQATEDDIPDELKEFGEKADLLSEARAQGALPSGKQRSVGFATALTKTAKDLRNRYGPGYAPYVDEQMKKVSGRDPANYQMAQLLGDINSKITSQSGEMKRTLAFAQQNIGFIDKIMPAEKVMQGIQQGLFTYPDIVKMVAPYAQRKVTAEMLKWQRENVDNERYLGVNGKGEVQGLATDEIDHRVMTAAGEATDKFQVRILGQQDPVNFVEFSKAAKSGAYTPQQLQQAGQQLNVHIVDTQREMMKLGLERNPVTGRTFMQEAGGQKAFEEKVVTSLKPLVAYRDAWYNGQYGITGALNREMSAQGDQLRARMKMDPNIGPQLQMLEALKTMGADGLANDMWLEMFKKGWDQKAQTFYGTYSQEFMAGTSAQKTGKHTTFNSFLEDAKKNNVITNEGTTFVFDKAMEGLKNSSLSPDVKYNLVQVMYGDGNFGLVEKMNKDGVDSKGRPILGTYYTYTQMTAPEVAQQIAELDKVKPGVWNQYVKWSTTTYRNLFVRELKDFESSYDALKGRGITVDWIKATGEFKPNFPVASSNEFRPAEFGLRDTQKVMENKIKSQFQKLNDGIKSLRTIATTAGKSPDEVEAFMLDTMSNAGWRPSADIKGLPEQMMQKLIGAKMAEEANKASRKSVEEAAGGGPRTGLDRGIEWLKEIQRK